jgi:hypothetical protein
MREFFELSDTRDGDRFLPRTVLDPLLALPQNQTIHDQESGMLGDIPTSLTCRLLFDSLK